MELSTQEPVSYDATRYFPIILYNPKFQYRTYNSYPLSLS
jgi:hypothetical protein